LEGRRLSVTIRLSLTVFFFDFFRKKMPKNAKYTGGGLFLRLFLKNKKKER
ncbi:MAG: hypothetical protein RL757_3224, partial [Bacteroidota bacterium]